MTFGSWEPLAFSIGRCFALLFMVVIGGLGSILGWRAVFFLVVEPNGLARLSAIGRKKVRLWPFPYRPGFASV